MHPKRTAAVIAYLATAIALSGSEWAAAESTGADLPPSVTVIDQRLLATEQGPNLDDASKDRIRGVYRAGSFRARVGGALACDLQGFRVVTGTGNAGDWWPN